MPAKANPNSVIRNYNTKYRMFLIHQHYKEYCMLSHLVLPETVLGDVLKIALYKKLISIMITIRRSSATTNNLASLKRETERNIYCVQTVMCSIGIKYVCVKISGMNFTLLLTIYLHASYSIIIVAVCSTVCTFPFFSSLLFFLSCHISL